MLILILIAALAIPLALVLYTNQSGKRGCGRGCATCGNRNICHKTKYKPEAGE